MLLAEKSNLEIEWVEIETLFEEKDLWETRAAWLDQNQPKFTSNEEIDQAIFKEAEAEDVEGVTTSKLALLPTVSTRDYVQAGVSLTASGELGDVLRWIYDLNHPQDFRVIRNLKISPDKEAPEKVVAHLELLRWYAPTGNHVDSAESPATPEEPET